MSVYAPRVYGSLYERFVPKVSIDRETGCWNWTASTNSRSAYDPSETP